MSERPEAFGTLRETETKRALGLVRRTTTDPARAGAAEAGRAGAKYVRANEARLNAASRSQTLRVDGGRSVQDPVARAISARAQRIERVLAGPNGRPLAGRRLRDLDARIARAAGRIGRVPRSSHIARGATAGTRRATQALAAARGDRRRPRRSPRRSGDGPRGWAGVRPLFFRRARSSREPPSNQPSLGSGSCDHGGTLES